MPEFAGPAPAEPTKSGAYLHDREHIPAPPPSRTEDLIKRYLGLGLGIVFGLALLALAFEARASWGEHRDWVVPVLVPFFIIGGVAAGYLVERRRLLEAGPGITLVLLAAALLALDIWRAQIVEGDDGLRTALTILATLALAGGLIALTGAMAWVEATDPTKPPPPET